MMGRHFYGILFFFLMSFVTLIPTNVTGESKMHWWDNTLIYQIYPRSFQDSDGDGIGDLKGIESRLDYLKDIGVKGVWLSPIYKSPMKDFGYDISDFKDIDPMFGSLKDFEELATECHKRDIKLIMDFVPNHSSNEHEWFQKSLKRQSPYTDYYVWEDPIGYSEDGQPIPPTNWVSVFRYSAWTYCEERGQFYLHQFLAEQPDLNYRNSLVLEEIKDVLQFWMDKGVDGFRMDAVAHIWEDDRYLDEPPNGNTAVDSQDYGYYDHIYTYNLPETRQVLKEIYDYIKFYGGEDILSMVEFYTTPAASQDYYMCSDFPFNFGLMSFNSIPILASEVDLKIKEWMTYIKDSKASNWVLGNHDQHRIGSKLGEVYMNIMNMITLTLPGVTITYQGEEIGMVDNYNITFEESVDPAGLNCGPDRYLECSRDPERTPMQWDDQKNAGFSTAAKCWLPVNQNYLTVNVKTESEDIKSHLKIYKAMAGKKVHHPTVHSFESNLLEGHDALLLKKKVMTKNGDFVVQLTVVNFDDSVANLNLVDFAEGINRAKVIASSLGLESAGSTASLDNLVLQPLEALSVLVELTD